MAYQDHEVQVTGNIVSVKKYNSDKTHYTWVTVAIFIDRKGICEASREAKRYAKMITI